MTPLELYRKLVWEWLNARADFAFTAGPNVSLFVEEVTAAEEPRGDTIASCGAKILHYLWIKGLATPHVGSEWSRG